MQKLGRLMLAWFTKFWVPLAITVGMLAVAVSVTTVMLYKQQITVQIPNLTLRENRGVTSTPISVLKQGEHLQILQENDGWYQVRREDESTGWVASWLLERTKPLDKVTPLSEATIVLDPGHGGNDPGAESNSGKFEKTYTLLLAQQVAKTLRATGARVIMTRDSDKLVYLSQIPKVAENANADAFISFHFDSVTEANGASGYTAYYYHKENGSKDLAQALNDAMKPNMPLENRGVEKAEYVVLIDNKVPAALLENGYINSDRDFKKIKSPSYRKLIAQDVAQGLETYFDNRVKTVN
ncbi:N-acetylmuramoyl-L-alanine amidase [Weissella sp. GP1]|uniref:N-acetylmuramoyl-L-alanine amidase n=1 Tax=Weissella fermenti TaxID=2987699 RepID=A0ABT6D4H7_9LACO|nr:MULTISPECIES: N-acetylmuramoyl-L-alanine amidase [Weissella]MBJ7688214.1 N-acetylmuramoyl-L-alanine amidase [Weissella confusa]MCW0926094.1 N-acetylmuramoyl-L-alanine amidase [Weissella sp. LMG 11983]MDF9300356.1 N-acetylmuramoyl-L-alanine amidase [Weissella sp. BK2]